MVLLPNPQPLQEMCSQYWPASGEKKQCGKYLSVELTEERSYVDYVHRDFKITFTDEVVSGVINKAVCRSVLVQQSKLIIQISYSCFFAGLSPP